MVSAPRCRPGARGLLALLLLLLLLPLPGARGECGALPRVSRAVPHDTGRTEGFPINTEVTYKCSDGLVKIPGKSDTVVCLSNSEWSNIGEFCNGACGAPPRLKSATLSTEDATKNYCPPGTTVSYVCRTGYESTELRPVVTCLENLTWSEAPEFCRGKSCGVPKGPEHGRAVDITNYRYGAIVNIICEDGFRLRGWRSIQCLLKGDQVEWSQLPTCEAIPCLPPPDITHGSHTGQSEQEFSFGSAVTYKCDQGFSLIGEASIHCTTKDNVNGKWSGPAPECKGKSCGVPKGPEHGRAVDITNYRYGAIVNIICEDGFRLRGRTFIQCELKGDQVEWSQLPTCEAIPCLPPPDITHGSHTGQSEQEFSFGSAVTYKCDQGFSLIGEASIHCTTKDNVNGEWSGPAPECKEKSCGVPKGPEHGRAVDTTNYLYGARVNIICDDGFRLRGRTFIQCELKGDQVEWSQLPTCEAITCSPPPNIANGMHNGGNVEIFDYNTSVTYKCDDNFSLTGEASIHCTTKDNINGVWNGPAPECTVTCYSPPRLSFAELPGPVNNSYPVGTKLKYSCHPEYMLGSGKSPFVTCLANSTWSVDPKFCVGRPCKQLELENGRVHFTDLRFGATANFSCNEGYRLNGPTSAQCVVAGNGVDWDKEVPLCEAISCPPPPHIPHGSHTGQTVQEFSFGSAVTYKCDQGFSLIGEAAIHCTTKDNVNGEWSGPAPECKAITCSPPPNIANGMHNGSNVEIFDCNSSVTYKCDDNFSLTGEASIHCTTKDNINGVWNGSAPECKVIITQDKPTTVRPKGPEVTGTSSGPSIDTHFDIADIGLGLAGIAMIASITGITVRMYTALNKKWQKKTGSYNVNPDSPKHQITTEHDFYMNESKCNLIFKV